MNIDVFRAPILPGRVRCRLARFASNEPSTHSPAWASERRTYALNNPQRCPRRNPTVALNAPSFPALTRRLSCNGASVTEADALGVPYHVRAHGEAVRAAFPVRACIAGCEPAPSEYRVSFLLCFLREHGVDFAAVDEQGRLRLGEVPLDIMSTSPARTGRSERTLTSMSSGTLQNEG